MNGQPEPGEIDLGHEHYLRWSAWSPDRSIPSNAQRFEGIADVERFGATVRHRSAQHPPRWCSGGITIDSPTARQLGVAPSGLWQVLSWEPLTISPSLLCSCGDHGWISSGRWQPA